MGRAPCCDKNGLKKGPWTPEEDQKLVDYIQQLGYGNWRTLPKNAGLQRCGKSCRLRWTNYLRPDIKRGRFSFEEEETIVHLHSILGNKWSAIAARLPGRTDNEIKNYWNTHIRKRLLRMGIDPVTHSPRLDLLDFSSILYNSSHHHNQVNFSRLLGMQQMGLNPELLRLATTLISSHRENNSNFLIQPEQDNHQQQQQQQQKQKLCNPQNDHIPTQPVQEPFHEDVPVCDTLDTCAIPFPHEVQSSNLTDFSTQNCQISDEWQSNGEEVPSKFTEDQHVQLPSLTHYDGSSDHHQIVNDVSLETSNLYSYNSNNQNFNFTSVFSTPSSSPTPLNSSSTTYFNSGTEDERESYCSNMLKFEIPDILDVKDFIPSLYN